LLPCGLVDAYLGPIVTNINLTIQEIIMAKAADYIDNVRKYDSGANEMVVQKVCNYLGIALTNRDSSLVSCSDQTELNRVINGFCAKN